MPPKTKTEDEKPSVLPAEAASAEATGDDVTMEWRDEKFVIPRDILQSARFLVAMAGNQAHVMLFELLGPVDSARLLQKCERGESLLTVSAEFFEKLGEAIGVGNSQSSG